MDQYSINNNQLPVKMEASPTESFLSVHGDYTPLFEGSPSRSVNSSPSIRPSDTFTPNSTLPYEALSPTMSSAPSPASHTLVESAGSQQKKKRKSWGQVLPEPKTNLPPRKRAKTEDEKEQRRVERVLRNRRAAQSSRERKRQEVELLVEKNRLLEEKLQAAEERNLRLEHALRAQQTDGQTEGAKSYSTLDNTLATNLFPQDEPQTKVTTDALPQTINMATLSPPSSDFQVKDDAPEPAPFQLPSTTARPSDATQHSAAMLCDLQCPSEPASNPEAAQAWAWMIFLAQILRASVLSAWQRPLTQISLSLKTGSPLVPSPSILTTILWLVTAPSQTSTRPSNRTLTSRSRTTSVLRSLGWRLSKPALISGTSTKVTNLKVKLLRKILSRSPILARPLMDATLAALRLVSSESHNSTVNTTVNVSGSPDVDGELTHLLQNMALPPRETLLALAWTLRCEMKKMASRRHSPSVVLESRSKKNAVSQHDLSGVTESVALQDAAVQA